MSRKVRSIKKHVGTLKHGKYQIRGAHPMMSAEKVVILLLSRAAAAACQAVASRCQALLLLSNLPRKS
jgi:hypothetical protein